MPRTLHLLEAEPDFETARTVSQLTEDIAGVEVASLGRGFASAIQRLRGSRAQVVHAWGFCPLVLAAILRRSPIVYSPSLEGRSEGAHWLEWVMKFRPVIAVASTASAERALLRQGVPRERVRLIRPALVRPSARQESDSALRLELGVLPNERLLLAVGESTAGAGHEAAVWATAVLHRLDPRYRLLLWGRGKWLGHVRRLADRQRVPQLVVDAQSVLGRSLEPEALAAVADVGLVTAVGPVSTVPIAAAMAAGLPLIATLGPAASELLAHGQARLVPADRSVKPLTRAVLDFFAEVPVSRGLPSGSNPMPDFTPDRLRAQFAAVYEHVIATHRERPAEPTAMPAASALHAPAIERNSWQTKA